MAGALSPTTLAAEPRLAVRPRLLLGDSFSLNFILYLSALFVFEGKPVPHLNEWLSLIACARQWSPDYLQGDWMLSEPNYQHLVFNFACGFPSLYMPLPVLAWIGRIGCWALAGPAFFKLGKHLSLPRWMVTFSLLLWLALDQNLVAGEAVLGGFEAKSVAYVFFLHALVGFIEERYSRAALLLGLAFSFQTAVGLWGGLALGLSLIVMRCPIRDLVKITAITIVFSLPGLITLLPAALGSRSGTVEDWRFLALVRMPHHLDPFSWSSKLLALLYGLLIANCILSRLNHEGRPVRLLTWFQVFLALAFTAGVAARWTESYGFLRLMPFRLFPVFTLLFFLFQAGNAWLPARSRLGKAIGLAGLVVLAATTFLPGAFLERLRYTYASWTAPEQDVKKAFRWLEANTEKEAIVVVPPWRKEAFYLAGRPQIVNWGFVPHDRMREWRERLDSLAGPRWQERAGLAVVPRMVAGYNARTERDLDALVDRYGARYLVSEVEYAYPKLFETGNYKVYRLTKGP